MNSIFKSRIVSRANTTPILMLNCRRVSQKTNINNNSWKNCRMIINLTNRHPYSKLHNWIISQGSTLYLTNLLILGKSDKNKLKNIGCVGIPQDIPPYNVSTVLCASAPVRPSPQKDWQL